tara:strand:- start:8209 stop:9183 length:975 start_codon:yes stop_codon:yes gene_type:complete
MNILLIGGSGTLGKRLLEQLNHKKNNIIIVCRKKPNDWKRQKMKYKFFFVDFYKDKNFKKKILKNKIDIVVNFICFNKKNAMYDYNLFKNSNLKKYFLISANGVYKSKNVKITESDKLDSVRNNYIKGKIDAENYLLRKSKKNQFPCKILRVSHIFDSNNIPTLFQSRSFSILKIFLDTKFFHLTSTTSNKWTILHAKDFAKILKNIIFYNKKYKEIINIASKNHITWKSLYEYYANCLNTKVKFKYLNMSKLKNEENTLYHHLRIKSKNLYFDTKSNIIFYKNIKFIDPKIELRKILNEKFVFLKNFKEDKILKNKLVKFSLK